MHMRKKEILALEDQKVDVINNMFNNIGLLFVHMGKETVC